MFFVGTYLHLTMGSISLAISFVLLALLHCQGFHLKLINPESSQSPFYAENISEIQNVNRGFEITRARWGKKKPNITDVPINYSSSEYITPRIEYFRSDYVAVIGFGTPVKEYYLIIDTGSDVTWIQCQGCHPCFPQIQPGPFQPLESDTAILLPEGHRFCNGHGIHQENNACRFRVRYADESVAEGLMLMDMITSHSGLSQERETVNFAFGCGISNSNFEFEEGNKIAGILGLGFSDVSLLHQTSKSRFSYCLPLLSTPYTYMTLGDDAAIHVGRVQHTPILPGDLFRGYVVGLIDISIGNYQLGLPRDLFKESDDGGMLIDTGTPFTRMHPFAYEVIVGYLRTYFSGLKPYDGRFGSVWADLCYEKMEHMPEIPAITYHFDEANLVVSGKNSFMVAKEFFCLGMLTDGKDTILGSYQQKNIRFLFDLELRQVSFAPEDC